MKIALAQINPTVGDFAGNAAKLRSYAAKAQQRGADLVLFPELSVCGYPPRDLVELPAFVARSRQVLEELATEFPGIAIIAGFPSAAPENARRTVMNSAALLRNGRIEFVQSKRLLPTYDVFDESRNFAPAASQSLVCIAARRSQSPSAKTPGTTKPSGAAAFTDLIRWRIWSTPARNRHQYFGLAVQRRQGALRQAMLASIARQHRLPVLLVNQVGGNDSLVFDGSQPGTHS